MPSWKKVVLHGSSGSLAHLKLENLTSQNVLGTDAQGNVVAGSVSGYTLPTATGTVLGGIKVGGTLTISAGVLNAKTYEGASGAGVGGGDGSDGVAGYVPAATSAQTNLFLRGDGTWQTPTNTVTRLRASAGTSYLAGDFMITGSGATAVSYTGGIFTITSTDTNTTYSVGDGGLTEKNFTTALKSKLDGIATSADNYSGWTISDSTNTESIRSGDTLTIRGAGATTVSYNAATNVMTVSSTDTDTNTTYSAGTGLTLSGTTFSVTANTYAAANHTHDDRYLKLTDTGSFFDRIIDAAPGTLDTLNELAAAIGDDANFSASIARVIAGKSDSGHTHSDATTSVAGFMSATDKTKLDGVAANANNYSLPTATASVLGGIKVGTNLSISNGVLSATDTDTVTAVGVSGDVSTGNIILRASGATSISKSGNTITISSTDTDTNTTYSAGTGLTLSGTTFSVTANTYAAADHNHDGRYYFQHTAPGAALAPTNGVDDANAGWTALDGYGRAVPNYPSSHNQWWVGVWTGGNSTRGIQLAGGYADNELYLRKGAAGWGGWIRLWNSSNLTNVSQLTNDAGYITSYVDTNTVTSVGISGDLSTGNIEFRGGGATTITKSGGTITITSTDTDTNTTYSAGTGLTLSGTTFSVTANTYAAADHNHDSRYYTETEADARFVLNDFGAQTAATAEDEKSGTWTESSGDSSWGNYKPGDDSTAGYSYNDAPGYVQYNIPTGYTTAYIGQLRWSTGGYFDVHAVMSDGSLVFRGRYLSLNSIENTSHSGNHDGQQIIKISGLDGMRSLRITNVSGRLHLQGIGWSKEVDTAGTQVSETHWDLIYNKPSSFTPSSHTHAISDITNLQSTLDGKQAANTAINTSNIGDQTVASSGNSNYLNTTRDTPSNSLQYWQASGLGITEAPDGNWYNTIRMGHGSPLSYYSNTLAVRMTGGSEGDIYTQTIMNGNRQGWKKHWNDGNDGAGSGLDADLLDGNHASAFAAASHTHAISDITNLQSSLNGKLGTGAKAADSELLDGQDSSYFYPANTPNGYSTGDINGNTTHQRLWGTDSVQDLIQFNPPTSVEYSTDGGNNWITTSISSGVFSGKIYGAWGGFNMNVGRNTGAWTHVRMTWVNFGYRFFSNFTLAHSTNGHSFNFVFQKSDLNGNNFTEAFRQNSIGSWPGYTFAKHSNVSGWWDTRDIRFVFELNNNSDFPNNAINIGHIGIMGSYGSFTRLFDWDGSRNMSFANNVDVNNNITVGGTVDGVDIAAFKTAYDSHNHDGRYYTESEVDNLLAGKQAAGSYLTSLPSHNHDDRYYTESEVDTNFARGYAPYQRLNLDTIKAPGLYQYDGGISGTQPEGVDQANLRTIEIGTTNRYTQLAFDWNSDQAWFRRQVEAGWQPWREFIHSGNIGSQSVNYAASAGAVTWDNVSSKPSTFTPSSHTHDDRYYTETESDARFLNLAGGTLTGQLVASGVSSGVSLHVGNGSTHGVYTDGNERKQLVVSADYYPHMALVAAGANNTNHGAVFSFVGTEGTRARQWNIGIPNSDPFVFSIGYNATGDNNPHYGVGDAWSGNDAHHARLSIDRSGNTKIRGMLYVNGTSGGITTGSPVLHSGNYGSYALPLSGGTVTGIAYFQTNNGAKSGATDSAKLQAYSTNNNSAFMSFHKSGHYAVNMGLDDDNVLRIGGWSASANRMQLDMSGNVTFAGNVTGYSDARIKTDVKTIDNALDKVKNLRGVSFRRTDSDDRSTNIGVIAQEVLEVLPEVVSQDASGMYNVAYGNMAGLFIEAIKQQQALIEQQQKQIDELKALVDGLTK